MAETGAKRRGARSDLHKTCRRRSQCGRYVPESEEDKKSQSGIENGGPTLPTRRPKAGGMDGPQFEPCLRSLWSKGIFWPTSEQQQRSCCLTLRMRMWVHGWWVGGHPVPSMIDQIWWGGSDVRLWLRCLCEPAAVSRRRVGRNYLSACDCSCGCTAATARPVGRAAATTDDPLAIVPANVQPLPLGR